MYQEMFPVLEIALSLILYKTEPEAKIEILKFHLEVQAQGSEKEGKKAKWVGA